MMGSTKLIVWTVVMMSLSSCIGPRPMSVSALNIIFIVTDACTENEIQDAQLKLIYRGPTGKEFERGPFLSDAAGLINLNVEKERLWVNASELYFGGGYYRSMEVNAVGYKTFDLSEGYKQVSFDKRPLINVKMKPFVNQFGSFFVRKEQIINGNYHWQIELMDGPNMAEFIDLVVWNEDENSKEYLGDKFYLLKSLDAIKEDISSGKISAFNPKYLFRTGLPEEPFINDKCG